ncbi:MipA/OmpV family protein [Pectobacterium atrosepticum]|uniref:MipA/OmpV family protein n=1 Tax=Pectobacterium atrosepticum TaxID=29471 RepID=UPI000499E5BB|nr:MipA/OmpV family protein [Pectobacterium atrosepticum]GKV84289.1 structural protein MipA [Pectobacterium carotovorum subsp. carotovorum]AIA71794.1 MltA-interacting MipA family protein [Pectobacterium atrosepticum]AIK14752.1 MltA-interacting MipA family protein [Pectobacterium atrosepticum]ATY91486.1 MipA/OmpV family protein [Pectobacterium atrosepticum]KFX11263.1 MltA-interacting MipA family protein [Pectobacterium atrosepticum]
MNITTMILSTSLSAIVLSGTAFAAESEASAPSLLGDHTDVTVGVAAQNAPRYKGSKNRQTMALPVLTVQRGALYFDSSHGIGWQYQSPSGFYLDHAIGYDMGRDDKNSNWRAGSNRLKGMGKIKGSVITTVTAGYQFAPWLALEASGEFALSETKRGNQYRVGAKSTVWQSTTKDDVLALSADVLMGDARFNQTYYGVTQQQSSRSGLAAYHAGKGVYGYALGANWTHQFSPAWSTNVGVTSTWLTDKVADSQVVERRNDTGATLAVLYSF